MTIEVVRNKGIVLFVSEKEAIETLGQLNELHTVYNMYHFYYWNKRFNFERTGDTVIKRFRNNNIIKQLEDFAITGESSWSYQMIKSSKDT